MAHVYNVWQETQDGMAVFDTLVEMLDYVQGFDTEAVDFGNLTMCTHFDKGEFFTRGRASADKEQTRPTSVSEDVGRR